MKLSKTLIGRLRITAFLEGVSFLLLLGICTPLKYLADIPEPTRIIGILHGLLFILFCWMLWEAKEQYGWSWKLTGWAFLSALLPFGTFVADVKIFRKET